MNLQGNKAEFHGDNGKIVLSACREGIYHIEYILDQYPQSPALESAAESLYSPEMLPQDAGSVNFLNAGETQKEFSFSLGSDLLVLRKKDGVLSVFHDEVRVHGGSIGSDDTVLPRYPLRVLGGTGDDTRARFNFKLDDNDRFYGLGDKTGGVNKRDHLYKMFNRDALGYRASFSDPLYKSIPFLLKHSTGQNSFSGLYFPVPRLHEVNLGRESAYFFTADINGGPFSYVIFTGDSAWDILEHFTWITGRPALPPLYTFGFLGSSMNYTEPDHADQLVTEYFDNIEKNSIPCEGFYFSSGYIKADNGERYTFEWNKKKFPDPQAALRKYRDRGYHIACNVKPGFLVTHPRYKELNEKGYFLKDSEGGSYKEYYWGNNASFIDFSNPEALSWWKQQLKEHFIDYGVSGIWNDNNELELEDQNLEAQKIRSLYPVQMSKASWDVYSETQPGKRPWVISRSGGIGLQKYARTWTGDNISDWESMKYNILMGLSLGLSGIPYYGHDIGGFFGDHPDAKQFIRWCQTAVFQPRFVIHSWNMDGRPTEIWSYPKHIDVLRELVELHYEFMPYIYNTAIEASMTGTPMERTLSLMFPEDSRIDPDCIHYMFGSDILVLSAVEEDEETVSCYLPAGTRWLDPNSGEYYTGGESVTIDYPYKGVRYLVKEGSVVATSPGCRKLDTGYFSSLSFSVVPAPSSIFSREYREDNGEDTLTDGSCSHYSIIVDFRNTQGIIEITRKGVSDTVPDKSRDIRLVLPEGFVFVSGDTETGVENGHNMCLEQMPEKLKLRFRSMED